jgi:hypothetical protein
MLYIVVMFVCFTFVTSVTNLIYLKQLVLSYIHIRKANIHCKGVACNRSIDMGLVSAESQKLDCFK